MSTETSNNEQKQPEKPGEEPKISNDAVESSGAKDVNKIGDEIVAVEKKPPRRVERLPTSKGGTVVNFQNTCELYEIDLENGTQKKEVKKLKPSVFKSIRYYVMLLALFSPFVTAYSRIIINFVIMDMVDPESVTQEKVDVQQVIANTTDMPYFDQDNSCPVSDEVRKRLIEESKESIQGKSSASGEKFHWDTVQQGYLKAAYAFGHMPFQIPGSRLSEMYGSHRILSASSFFIAICCLSAPFLAALSYYLFFFDLFLLGVLGSFMAPALITLFSNWLTPSEKSLMLSFYVVASRLGYSVSSLLCGHIKAMFSWKYVFFSAGWISFTYSAVFFLLARSKPEEHPLISKSELDYLATKNTLVRESLEDQAGSNLKQDQSELKVVNGSDSQKQGEQQQQHDSSKKITKKGAPWVAILTSVPVWAFIITKFCVKMAGDTVQIELPVYLQNVMHFSAKDNGLINSINYVVFCVGCLLAGALAKVVMKKRPFGLEKTGIRRCFQCFASFTVALSLLGIAYSTCDDISTQMSLWLLFFATAFSTGGEAQIPLDITERYPGTIHAIGSSIAISGIIEPILVGFFIRGHSADRFVWTIIWLGASVISIIGGLVFLIFADATIQPFDSIENEEVKGEQDEGGLTGKDNSAYVKDLDGSNSEEKIGDNQDDKPYRESRQI